MLQYPMFPSSLIMNSLFTIPLNEMYWFSVFGWASRTMSSKASRQAPALSQIFPSGCTSLNFRMGAPSPAVTRVVVEAAVCEVVACTVVTQVLGGG